MKRLQQLGKQLQKQLRTKAGYAMLMVLSALLLFTVLGSNALLAAQASAGATTRKQEYTQAHVFATSALHYVSEMMEQNAFSAHIQKKVFSLDAGAFLDSYAKPIYVAPVTAQLELPDMPASVEQPSVTLDFTVEGLKKFDLTAGGKGDTVDLLTVRVWVNFRSASYSYLADFYHFPNQADATKSTWQLKGFRNNRDYVAYAVS